MPAPVIRSARPHPPPPVRKVHVEEVIDQYSGGTQSLASVARIDGETRFLRSQKSHGAGRYANFEADLLAGSVFDLVGLKAPATEVVRLQPGSPLRQQLGPVVLSMEYVNSDFAGHRKVAPGAWGLRENAVTDAYMKMTLTDILLGNADRRGANYLDRWTSQGRVYPVPIDNNSGLGNLVNQKTATNHCNFIPSYSGAGETPGLRQNGTIANILLDTTLHTQLLDEPHEQARMLELARDFVNQLTDERIEAMVEALPREIIPRGARVELEGLQQYLGPQTLVALANGARDGLAGRALYDFRKSQIKETLTWRRDHLVEALQDYFAAPDPLQRVADDWQKLA